MLLSLITVEAQSYGPKACILMRVIETVSGGAGPPPLPPPFTVNPSTPLVTPTVVASPQKLTPQLMRAPSPSKRKLILKFLFYAGIFCRSCLGNADGSCCYTCPRA